MLAVPLRQQGELIGNTDARRIEVRPFTPAQIKLLETFANQAVIAIENVRLFTRAQESLEQQTATSEILGVIASSPTDIQPVLDAVARVRHGCATQPTLAFVSLKGTSSDCGAALWMLFRCEGERSPFTRLIGNGAALSSTGELSTSTICSLQIPKTEYPRQPHWTSLEPSAPCCTSR